MPSNLSNRMSSLDVIVWALILFVFAMCIMGFAALFNRKEVKNVDGVFWMDSLVCTTSGCTMTIRNDSEDRLEVLVSRETANFISTPVK